MSRCTNATSELGFVACQYIYVCGVAALLGSASCTRTDMTIIRVLVLCRSLLYTCSTPLPSNPRVSHPSVFDTMKTEATEAPHMAGATFETYG